MLDGIFMQTKKMITAIKGMDGHSQSFDKKYEKEMQQTKDFVWIFTGEINGKKWKKSIN